jgi:hypothetical protein
VKQIKRIGSVKIIQSMAKKQKQLHNDIQKIRGLLYPASVKQKLTVIFLENEKQDLIKSRILATAKAAEGLGAMGSGLDF